jgi:signal transduction histidine kinase
VIATIKPRYKEPWPLTNEEYCSALETYLDGAGELALQRAYEIGRSALGAGVGVVELARMHHAALENILIRNIPPEEKKQKVKAAADFFAEAVSPFEMAYLGFREASLALRHFNDMLEREAKRIAHALHAESGQLLVAVYIALEQMTWKHPRAKPQIGKVRNLLVKIEEQLRRLSHELRPAILDDLGLIPAVRYLAEGISLRTGLVISIDSTRWDKCSAPLEAALYRIVQEALNNIAKHAQATHAWVSLTQDARLIRCSIRDDGIGFDVSEAQSRNGERGFGLMGIRERVSIQGGSVQVNSAGGQGTDIVVTMPLED